MQTNNRITFQQKLTKHIFSDFTRSINEEREKYESLHIKLRQVSNEMQDLKRDHEILARNYNSARNRIEGLLGDKAQMQETITKLHSDKKIAEGKYTRNTQVLKTDLAKLETQDATHCWHVQPDQSASGPLERRQRKSSPRDGGHTTGCPKMSPGMNKGNVGGRKVEDAGATEYLIHWTYHSGLGSQNLRRRANL